ncbi:glycoside hydrolase family 9 protein [Atractiella rhizophila]|nr:glycoside hydrolase family 9 protein [Atractiella rhizophila]
MLHIFLLAHLLQSSFAQVSGPDYNPPDASNGLTKTSGGSVPNPQWSNLLGNLLWFYDAQRSGALGPDNRVPWRNDSSLNDGKDAGVDLSRGWYDAGNYIKATFPLSWTLTSLSWSAIDFGHGFSISNQDRYLDSTLRWGYDWLINAHPSANELFVQVATDNDDDFYWGGDQGIPTNRPSFKIDMNNPGTDAAASTAAAFAAGAYLYNGGGSLLNDAYSSTTLKNTTYADILLGHAKDLWTFSRQANQKIYSDSVKEAQSTYPSSGLADSLVFSSLWMYLATNDNSYLSDAKTLFNSNDVMGKTVVANWDSKYPAVYVLAAEMEKKGIDVGGSGVSEGERWCDSANAAGGAISYTSGGLVWWEGDSQAASLNPALNAAQLCLRMSQLSSNDGKKSTYVAFSNRQTNYALGENDMNVPYVVGQHPNSPLNPHSALAAGGNDPNNIDSSPPQEAYVLYGGVVGGPDQKDRYFDIRSDWPETEIALDYQAPLVALAAYYTINNASDPFYVSLAQGSKVVPEGQPTDAAFPGGSGGGGGGLSSGASAAIAVVVVVVVLAGAVLYHLSPSFLAQFY